MMRPINLIFNLMKQGTRVKIWMYENTNMFMEGTIMGFDEYMNVVLDDAAEVPTRGEVRQLGRVLLKGDTITLIQEADVSPS